MPSSGSNIGTNATRANTLSRFASETFDVAQDLGSPVTLDYFERAPFAFKGKVKDVHVTYLP